jgi:GNAT superfamily N-acetyltransferase
MESGVRTCMKRDMEEAYDLLELVMNAHHEYFDAAYRNDTGSRPENSLVFVEDGKIRSHIRLYYRTLFFYGIPVRCGEIGDVCTHPDYRRRGQGKALLLEAARIFREEGCGFSMIMAGNLAFYGSGGWEPVPTDAYRFRPASLSLSAGGRTYVRRFERFADIPAVHRIHDAWVRTHQYGTARDRRFWERHFCIKPEIETMFLVAEERGRIVAYSRFDGGAITECPCLPGYGHACTDLLECYLRQWRKKPIEEVRLCAPANHPLVDAVRSSEGFAVSAPRGSLMRLVNLPLFLRKLETALSKNAREAGAPDAELAIETNVGEKAALRVSGGRVRAGDGASAGAETVKISQVDFFRLLSGRDRAKDVGLGGKAAEILDALFPPRPHCLGRIDRV